MAERFSLVNRGYDAVKVGPSTTNRFLRPPRRVGEITPTTNLRDEKNAKGPLAKLPPETQFGDHEGRDRGLSTAQQAANEYAGGNLRGEFDTTPPSDFEKGLVAVGKTVIGAVVAPLGIAMAIEDYRNQDPLSLGGRLSILTQGNRKEKLLQEYRTRRDNARAKYSEIDSFRQTNQKSKAKQTQTKEKTEDKQPIRTAKQQAQEKQLQKTYSDAYGIGGGFQDTDGTVAWT